MMQTQGLTTRLDGQDGTATRPQLMAPTAPRGSAAKRLALSTFVVGVAVGAWSGWTLDQVVASPAPTTAAKAAPIVLDPPVDPAGRRATASGRSLTVAMPSDDTYLNSPSIPVAGTAYGRPHGPIVRSVHVELIVAGRSIESADFEVFSGRFAGVLDVPALDDRVEAELHISDALHQGDNALVRHLTIDGR